MRGFVRSRFFSAFALLLALRISLQRGPTTDMRKMMAIPIYGSCPVAIHNVEGIYASSGSSTAASFTNRSLDDASLQNVVLLVSANYGYRRTLQLWTSMADRHQLQYAIVSMDRQLKSFLQRRDNTKSVVLASQRTTTDASTFRSPDFNTITCNKMQVVLDILEHCKMDVVFSDVDNIFLQDPFQGELGHLIRSGQYDYIYQHNDRKGSVSCWKGDLKEEGNTGFYYLSHTSSIVQDVMRETLRTCKQPDNKLDDQTLFWNAMRETFRHHPYRHCNATGHNVDFFLPRPEMDNDSVTQMCCLNGTLYPTGMGNVSAETQTFHANYLVGQRSKIQKLREVMQELNLPLM